jgi:gamma-glutamylcyclotransferase (GGCT)/AIG2-like uncharacterized protein YtfP
MSDWAIDSSLAVYGSLAPGRINNHQLNQLNGNWRDGTVHGWLSDDGWGATLGYPGLVLDPDAPAVQVFLFESSDLPDHWARLDEFEGAEYKRVVAQVHTADGEVSAWIYVIAHTAVRAATDRPQ